MDASRWPSAKQLLADVVDLPEAQQRAYIEQHCTDPILRRELLAMLESPASVSQVVAGAMTLPPGTRIGVYEIVELIGAGGMGEVYRARDPKLGRDVAIKVLPPTFASDSDRLARLEREARLLASLNHPNIAHVYGLEESDGAHAVVMELIEGETLAERIAHGPLPLTQVLAIARQMCEALEAAHDHGIIHRDLKPANVKVRPDGTVKVLDFGLARVLEAGDPSSVEAMQSPTLTAQGTRAGVILGTAAYMSPEQARGQPADRRADIWAFGAVLYELLTGRRAFGGNDTSDTLAAVLKEEPDWTALPPDVPGPVRRLLRRCLEKDSRQRLRAIGDARLELDEGDSEGAHGSSLRPLVLGAWLAGAVLAGLAVGSLATLRWSRSLTRPMLPAAEVTRLWLAPASGVDVRDSTSVVISPDGQMVVMATGAWLNPGGLWVRSLDALAARPLVGTHGAMLPFWSPDSRHIGFFSDQKLKTVDLQNGHVEEICAAPNGFGGAWNRDDVILFAPGSAGPLQRISASGGTPVTVVSVDDARAGHGYRFPQFLPDGDHFLAAVTPLHAGAYDIVVGSLRDGAPVVLLPAESTPVFSAAGSALLFMRKGSLVAQPFDATRRVQTGPPVPLGDSPAYVGRSFPAGPAVSVSTSGSIAYVGPIAESSRVVVFDQAGRPIRTLDVPPGNYRRIAVTPDGRRAALIREVSPVTSDLWVVDLDKRGASRLTDASKGIGAVAWAPDGERVAYSAAWDGPRDVYIRSLTDATEHVLYRSKMATDPFSWSRDGRYLLATDWDSVTNRDILVLPATSQNEPARAYLRTPFNEVYPRVSPDGRWLAYASDKTGQYLLYVDAFPTPEREVRVTSDATQTAWWRTDSRQLLIVSADGSQLSVADVRPGPTPAISTPRVVGHLPNGVVVGSANSLSVTGDLQRVVALVEDTPSVPVTIVEHWPVLLDKR